MSNIEAEISRQSKLEDSGTEKSTPSVNRRLLRRAFMRPFSASASSIDTFRAEKKKEDVDVVRQFSNLSTDYIIQDPIGNPLLQRVTS